MRRNTGGGGWVGGWGRGRWVGGGGRAVTGNCLKVGARAAESTNFKRLRLRPENIDFETNSDSTSTPAPTRRRPHLNPPPPEGGAEAPLRFFVCHCQSAGESELKLSDF